MDKVFSMKVDTLWLSWATMLAKESGRSRAGFIRDLIYFLVMHESGKEFIALMTQEGVKYGDR